MLSEKLAQMAKDVRAEANSRPSGLRQLQLRSLAMALDAEARIEAKSA